MLKILDQNGRRDSHADFDRTTATAYVGKLTDSFSLRAHDLGHGHREFVGSRVAVFHEADWSPEYLQDVIDAHQRARDEADPAEVAARSAERAARRAKGEIRRLCKTMGATALWTLTYRRNETRLEVAKANMKEFDRRVCRVWPEFRCVVGFEPQKRGAWHMHLAVASVPPWFMYKGCWVRSFDVLRSIWRAVVGDLEVEGPMQPGVARVAVPGGNIDVQRRRRHRSKSAAQVAAYISKYITKAYASGDKWSNRWTKYGKVDRPAPVDLGVYPDLLAAMADAFVLIDPSQSVLNNCLDDFRDWFFLVAERRD